MKPESVRTTIDIPAPLYQQLEELAVTSGGRSVSEIVLAGARNAVLASPQAKAGRVKFPLFGYDGPKVELTDEQIYEHVEFP